MSSRFNERGQNCNRREEKRGESSKQQIFWFWALQFIRRSRHSKHISIGMKFLQQIGDSHIFILNCENRFSTIQFANRNSEKLLRFGLSVKQFFYLMRTTICFRDYCSSLVCTSDLFLFELLVHRLILNFTNIVIFCSFLTQYLFWNFLGINLSVFQIWLFVLFYKVIIISVISRLNSH